MATTTLPKLAAGSARGRTPAPTPIQSISRPLMHVYNKRPSTTSMFSVYATYPPIDIAYKSDNAEIPKRINPLRPPSPYKRQNHMIETQDAHHHNEKRSMLMKQREHHRYHSWYSKAMYGSPAEKEDYRKQTRDVLKTQMFDRSRTEFWQRQDKVLESQVASEQDRQALQEDADKFKNTFCHLNTFPKENKKIMEEKWHLQRFHKKKTDLYDCEQIRYNPINWSKSLS